MDLKQAKEEKIAAQHKIHDILHDLQMKTGICPTRLEFDVVDMTTFSDQERVYGIGCVRITLEVT